MKFVTLNSTYEFSTAEIEPPPLPVFRRVTGKNPSLLPVPDGEWMEYREAVKLGQRLYIEWGDGHEEKIYTSIGEWVYDDEL